MQDLSAARGGVKILHDVSFEVKSGEICALIGANGAGKSTLLRCIAGLEAVRGSVSFSGLDLLALDLEKRAKILSFMPQFSNSSDLSVSEILSLARRAKSGRLESADYEKIEQTAKNFGFESWLGASVQTLSGGQRQKVFIAASLLQEPQILLLDEPISHLDPKNQHEMLELIRAQTQELGLITIAVLHDIHHALHYARDLIMLKKGRVLSCKASRDVCDADLEHLFEMRLSIHEIRGHKFVYFGHSHAGI